MPVIIKRYRNRKLYNTQSKHYVTLDELADLIKQQEDIQVIENDTGNDITATTLSQIIFATEKNQEGELPVNLLFSLIQSGGKRIEEIRQNIFHSLNFAHHFDHELSRRIEMLIENGEFTQSEGNQLLEKLLALSPKTEIIFNIEDRIVDFLKESQIPTHDDVQDLMKKIDTLTQKVESIDLTDDKITDKTKNDQIIS
jgi:polyhydroxyalkanoate synthesis repressor PhaR